LNGASWRMHSGDIRANCYMKWPHRSPSAFASPTLMCATAALEAE
jgi:hypothetical protein